MNQTGRIFYNLLHKVHTLRPCTDVRILLERMRLTGSYLSRTPHPVGNTLCEHTNRKPSQSMDEPNFSTT